MSIAVVHALVRPLAAHLLVLQLLLDLRPLVELLVVLCCSQQATIIQNEAWLHLLVLAKGDVY